MTAGDIVLVHFQGAMGIKRRPAIIVSSDDYHQSRPDLVLAVITTKIDSANTLTDYLLKDWHIAGLRKPSAFRAYLGTYEQRLFTSIVGKVSDRDWEEIQERLRIAIAVNS